MHAPAANPLTAPEELSSSEARLWALVQYSSDVITVLAPDGTVQYNTPAVRHVLGYEPSELLGRWRQQLLERDRAAEPLILGGDDPAHAAARDLAVGAVVRRRHHRQERQLAARGRVVGRIRLAVDPRSGLRHRPRRGSVGQERRWDRRLGRDRGRERGAALRPRAR